MISPFDGEIDSIYFFASQINYRLESDKYLKSIKLKTRLVVYQGKTQNVLIAL